MGRFETASAFMWDYLSVLLGCVCHWGSTYVYVGMCVRWGMCAWEGGVCVCVWGGYVCVRWDMFDREWDVCRWRGCVCTYICIYMCVCMYICMCMCPTVYVWVPSQCIYEAGRSVLLISITHPGWHTWDGDIRTDACGMQLSCGNTLQWVERREINPWRIIVIKRCTTGYPISFI